jgi:hypothetical protein
LAPAKDELANNCPNDVDEPMGDILGSIKGIRNSSEKLRGCIAQSEFSFFFALKHCILYAATKNHKHVRLLQAPLKRIRQSNAPALFREPVVDW